MVHPSLTHSYNYANKDNDDWPNFFRLVSVSGLATLATLGNIFTISSIIMDDLLRKKGNSFLVSLTLADLLLSAFVLPAISVAILAQIEDSVNLCKFQYGFGCLSCVTAAVFTAIVGIENCLRLRKLRGLEIARQRRRSQSVVASMHLIPQQPPEKYSVCSQFQVTLLNLMFWSVAATTVLVHSTLMPQFTYAICGSSKPVNDALLFDSIIAIGSFILFFISLGGLSFLKCICIMRSWTKPLPFVTSREIALIYSNFWTWLVRFLIWCPSIVAAILTQMDRSIAMVEALPFPTSSITQNSTSSPTRLQQTLSPMGSGDKQQSNMDYVTLQRLIFWSAVLPSCLASLIYACTNKDLRRCYVQLFNYCCCKTSVTLTRRPRDNLRSGNDVRVHIIPGYNIYSSGHNEPAPPPRFNAFKCGPLMTYRREVYEL